MTERPLANLDLEKAIALRWALRDILGNRLKLSPVKDDDLRTLIDLGFVEMRDDSPVVTPAGDWPRWSEALTSAGNQPARHANPDHTLLICSTTPSMIFRAL